jgi:MFS family permease
LDKSNNRSVWIVAGATALMMMGIGMVDPLLPDIARHIGASPWQVELLFTTYILTMAVCMIPISVLSARFGSRRTILFGLAMAATFAVACGLSDSITALAFLRGGWGLGNAAFFATAMITVLALAGRHAGTALGRFEGAFAVGLALGPLVGGVLGSISWRAPFFGAGTMFAATFVASYLLIREPPADPAEHPRLRDLAAALRVRPFLLLTLIAAAYYFCFFTVLAYTPLYLDLGVLPLGIVFSLWGLGAGIGSISLSDRLIRRRGLVRAPLVSLPVLSALVLTILLTGDRGLIIILVILSGLAFGTTNAIFTDLAIDVSSHGRRVASGAFNFMRWLGASVGPVLAGLLSAVAPKLPYAVVLLLLVTSFLALFLGRSSLEAAVRETALA